MDPDAPETVPEPAPVLTFPSAAETLRRSARGTVTAIAGQEWLLADYRPDFSAVWDNLYDSNALTGRYDPINLRSAAAVLILACHDIPPRDAVALVWHCDDKALVAAVEAAMFGPVEPRRTWSAWALASLRSNGVDPDSVPKPQLGDVLELLVLTGRTVPAERWVTSAELAREQAAGEQLRGALRAMAQPKPPAAEE